ncbi:MAG: hypothetical protein ACXVBJ_09860 [Flavisolibacter sp.]
MEVHCSGCDLQNQWFKVKGFKSETFTGTEPHDADSSFTRRYSANTRTLIWNSLSTIITRVLVALIVITFLLGMIMYLTGVGTGPGILCSVFVLTLMAITVPKKNCSPGDHSHPGVSILGSVF